MERRNLTVNIKRRILPVREPIEWESKILKHLKAKNRWDYGCLNKAGELFTIKTLSTVNVPKEALNKLISNKQIALGEDDYYYVVNN